MYGEIVIFYEIAVHFCIFNISVRGRGKPLPYACGVLFSQPRCIKKVLDIPL